MRSIKEIIAACSLFYCGQIFSQNINSPYSVYGIGDIDFRSYNRSSGMANTGLALKSSFYIIDNNPASITGLSRSFYTMNIAMAGKSVIYKGDPIDLSNSQNKDFWIKRLGITVKLNNSWASSVGMKQFSNINYLMNGTKTVDGSTETFGVIYEGDGSLNEYYWTNAFSIGKHFSFGVQSSIISGSINHTETIAESSLQSVISTRRQDYFGQARFQFGALYSTALNKKWDLSLGGKFIPKIKMVSERTVTVTENETPIVQDEFIKYGRFSLPNAYGVGIALTKNKKNTYTFDYNHEDWSALNISQNGMRLINSNRFSGGVEFSKQQWNNQLVEKRYFQVGAFYTNSYLRIRNTPINEYGITAGTGGTLSRSLLYTLSAEVGTRGTKQNGLIKENYAQLSIGLSFTDYLFSKGRKYD